MLDFLENAGLGKLERAVVYGLVLAVVLLLVADVALARRGLSYDYQWIVFFVRWLHVLSGVMWVGLLWYFNFVQIPNMPKIPDEQKPAISKVIAPEALFWFRWAAMATILTGLFLSMISGYMIDAITMAEGARTIGLGMWLGTIMWFNVWFVIWPNQKRALGIVQVEPDVKAKSARTAMLFSRTNMILSVPMLFCMVGQQNGIVW